MLSTRIEKSDRKSLKHFTRLLRSKSDKNIIFALDSPLWGGDRLDRPDLSKQPRALENEQKTKKNDRQESKTILVEKCDITKWPNWPIPGLRIRPRGDLRVENPNLTLNCANFSNQG